jgi:hypothetical protein
MNMPSSPTGNMEREPGELTDVVPGLAESATPNVDVRTPGI